MGGRRRTPEEDAFALHIGRSIERLRMMRGIKRLNLCRRAHISSSALYNFESGRNIPSAFLLGLLASCLGVSVESFYRHSDK